jgi:outer membrane protein assembly complex protein YaeT
MTVMAALIMSGQGFCLETNEIDESVVKPKYLLLFEGNKHLSEAKLKSVASAELTLFEENGFQPSDIDDAAYKMEIAYLERGFAFVNVDYRLQAYSDPVAVTILISEGPQIFIDNIIITGNTAFDDKTLGLFFKSQERRPKESKQLFVRPEIKRAISQIEDYYLDHGFFDVQIPKPEISFSSDRTQAHVRVHIEEGVRYMIREVHIVGDVGPEVEDDIHTIRGELVGKPYVRRPGYVLRTRLLFAYQNLGYAFAEVKVDEKIEKTEGDVTLTASVRKGPVVTISEVVIRGNKKTKESFIMNRVLLGPGDRYSASKRDESSKELYYTGLFSKVSLNLEQQYEGSSAILAVEVVEAPSLEFFLEPGWGSYEKLRLKVGVTERNLAGRGIIISPEAKLSFLAQSLTLRLTEPWLFNTTIAADFPMYYSHRIEPSFTRQDLGLGLSFSKNLSERWKSTAGYGLRTTELSDIAPEALSESPESDYNLGSISAQATFDSRNDLFFPLKGQRFFVATDYADRWLGGDIALGRLTTGIRLFFELRSSLVLGFRYTSGILIPGPDEITLPISERFFNGGENTVRSFKQSQLGPKDIFGDPIGGYGFNVFNIELRQRIYGNFIGALFFDLGNVSPNKSRFEQGLPPFESRSDLLSATFEDFFAGFRPGIGIGLQYLLPIGPLRLDFAYNPDFEEERGEEAYVLHFSVGTAF